MGKDSANVEKALKLKINKPNDKIVSRITTKYIVV